METEKQIAKIREGLVQYEISKDRINQFLTNYAGSCATCKWSGLSDLTFDNDLVCLNPAIGGVSYDVVAGRVDKTGIDCDKARDRGLCGPEGILYKRSILSILLYPWKISGGPFRVLSIIFAAIVAIAIVGLCIFSLF